MLVYEILRGDGPLTEKLIILVMFLSAILLAIIVHEMCHGAAAYALGDPTAKQMGRLSFNPVRHIDPFGALMMLVAGFGWAKPVMVDARYFANPKRGMAIVALAGPLSNFALAFAAVACLRLTISMSYLPTFFYFLALLNIGLGMFNLIPIPPLDGSKILGSFLPNRLYYTFMQYERYGMLALMALIILGNFTDGRYNFFRFLGVYREAVFIWMLGVFGIS